MPPKKGQGRSRGRGRAQATAKSLPQKRSQQAPSRGQTQSGKKKKKKVEGLVDDDELVQRLMDLDNSSTLRKQRPRDDQGNLLPFDYRYLTLKPDHENRPFWVRGDGLIHLEAFSPLYEQARDFLVAICEPVSRPQFVHEYKLDKNALFAAASMGLTADLILKALNKLSKTPVEASVEDFVRTCTAGYGKVKLVLERGRYYIESGYPSVLRFLTKHPVIAKARVKRTEEELQEEAERIQRTGEAGVEAAYTSEGFLVRKKQQEKEESIGLKGVIDIDSKNADNGETRTTAENKEQEDALLGRITGEVNSDEEEDVEEEDETANNDNEENNVPQNGKEKNSKLKSIPETERRQDRRIFSQFGSHRDDTRITHTETFTELGRRLIRALVGIERCNVVLDSSRFGLNNDLSDSSSTQTGNHGRCSLQSALEQTCAKVVANHSAWLDTKRRTSSKDTFLHQGLECYKRSNKISDRRNRVHKQKLAKLEWEQNHGPMPDDDEEARISRHQRQLRHREEYIDTDWATKQAETNDAGESSLATSSGNNTAPSQKENKTGAMSDSDSEFDLEEDDNDDDECDELGAQHVDEEEEEDMKELTNEAKKFGEYEKQRQLQKKKFIVDDEDEEVDLKPLKSIGVELSFTDDASRQEYLRAREEARREVEEGSRDLSSQVLRFEIDPELVDSVKRACIIMDPPYPLMHEYDFKKDIFSPSLDIELRRPEGLRPYQSKSLAKMFGNSRARSGLIVLPCGAGKTLVGIAAVSTLKKNALVLCPNVTAVDQWVEQFQLFSTINAAYLIRLTSKSKTSLPPPDQACIVFTTYSMIGGDAERRATVTNELLRQIGERDWGLMILDETHQVVAKTFRRVLRIRAHCRVGLTATLVREDGAQRDLSHLIGPKLYEANWMDLTRAGYLANVEVCEVWCPMAKEFYKEYLRNRDAMTRRVLATMNPIKCYTLHRLLEIHKQRPGDKIIVFSESVYALNLYAAKFGAPVICGDTPESERQNTVHAFRNYPNVNVLFLSKVGDVALDVPDANVIIQISSHYGSRLQEAQRMGRILRRGKQQKTSSQFNAFFYTLISTDTMEVFFSNKRRRYLVDQGYAYKTITSVPHIRKTEMDLREGCPFMVDPEERLEVLQKVLTSDVRKTEEKENDVYASFQSGLECSTTATKPFSEQELSRGIRHKGSMAALSGGAGIRYIEYSATQQRQAAKDADEELQKERRMLQSQANAAPKQQQTRGSILDSV